MSSVADMSSLTLSPVRGAAQWLLVFTLLFPAQRVIAFDDLQGKKAAEMAGSYLGAVAVLERLQLSPCGYAVVQRPNMGPARLEVLSRFPPRVAAEIKYATESQEFRHMADQIAHRSLSSAFELMEKGMDKNTACGKMVAIVEAGYGKAREDWNWAIAHLLR